MQDISRLIFPSAESLATYGAKNLDIMVESVNEGWNNSIPLTGTRPQPDYSIGFQREAFTDGQLAKLSPFIGDFIAGDLSYFIAPVYDIADVPAELEIMLSILKEETIDVRHIVIQLIVLP